MWRPVIGLLMGLLVCCSGCQKDEKAVKEKFIADMLTAFGKQKKDLLKQAQGVFEDIRVYRDGKQDVIVFERKLAEGNKFNDPELKSHLVSEIKKSESSTKALELGIQVRLIDKTSDGEVLSDVTLSSDDL